MVILNDYAIPHDDTIDLRELSELVEEILSDDDYRLNDSAVAILDAISAFVDECGYRVDTYYDLTYALGQMEDEDVTLIAKSYFKEYAQELAEDIGAIDPAWGWPTDCIDWDRAASELSIDYSLVTLDSRDYYWRG